jgi:uncharacterized protein YidB (DUF937 family)
MDISAIATKLLNDNMGLSLDSATVNSALSSLVGDGQGGIDLGGLVSKMSQNGDLSAVLSSWLGDGANSAISPDTIASVFGQADIAKFASQLGIDPATAQQGLANALPGVVDKASSGGNLLDSVGGVGGLMGMAKSLLS